MLLLIGYKGNCLEAPELTSTGKGGEFSWHVVYGLVEIEIFAATNLPEAHFSLPIIGADQRA